VTNPNCSVGSIGYFDSSYIDMFLKTYHPILWKNMPVPGLYELINVYGNRILQECLSCNNYLFSYVCNQIVAQGGKFFDCGMALGVRSFLLDRKSTMFSWLWQDQFDIQLDL
jgi:hypothetical protein